MDRFSGCKSAEETLRVGKEVIRDLVPWDYAWAKDMEVADENGWLLGGVTPTVRAPVGRLPSGRVVEQILARGEQPFDADWMTETFEVYWKRHGAPTTRFNNLFLEPLPDAGKQVLVAQYGSTGEGSATPQKIADAFIRNFEDPALCTEVIDTGPAARAFIAKNAGGGWLGPVLRGALGVGREQARQAFGGQPKHPLASRS